MTDRTNAERQRRFIERLKARAAEGVTNASDTADVTALKRRVHQLGAELAREQKQREAAEAKAAVSNATVQPHPDKATVKAAPLEARIRELEDKLALARIATGKLPDSTDEFVAMRRIADEIRKKEKAAKAARQGEETFVTLDPAARHLRRRVNSASFTDKTKIVKALTEQTTSAAARHAGLQVWNALRTNKGGGKRKQ